jgi:hypothetical protein
MSQTNKAKSKMTEQQRNLRRNQLIWVALSGILILTMLISLIRF